MAVLVMTCPHCGAENMTFNVLSECPHPNGLFRTAIGLCGQCAKPVEAMIKWDETKKSPSHDWGFQANSGNLFHHKHLVVVGVWPEAQPIDAPAATPDKVAKCFIEAAKAKRNQLWNAACGTYRRCMEIALKEFAPDVEAWKLEKRIDKLAAEHRITPDIQAWAHELRLDGNEALHGEEDATEDMTNQMHQLTFFLLTYLYSLPQQIADARARRDAAVPAPAPAP